MQKTAIIRSLKVSICLIESIRIKWLSANKQKCIEMADPKEKFAVGVDRDDVSVWTRIDIV